MTESLTPNPIDDLLKQPAYSTMVERVRAFLRDYIEVNRLIEGYESNERDILFAITLTIDDINSTPPPLTKDITRMIQAGWAPLIILGSVITILRSVILVHIRNHLPFNDGGVMTGGLSDRYEAFQRWVDRATGEYENKKKLVKVSANQSEMMGYRPTGLPSEYALVHGLGRFWW